MGYIKLNTSLKHISNKLKKQRERSMLPLEKYWQNAKLQQQQQQQHWKCSISLYDDDLTLFETKLEAFDFQIHYFFIKIIAYQVTHNSYWLLTFHAHKYKLFTFHAKIFAFLVFVNVYWPFTFHEKKI